MQHRRLWAFAAAAAIYLFASGCSEDLSEGKACPALCPNQSIPVHDTVIDGLGAISIDTTITGYPLLGTEPQMILARSGDTIDVRTIIRFDSIPVEYRPTTSDTLVPAKKVFKAYVRLGIDTTSGRPRNGSGLPTISVYDVDTTGSDTAIAVLASLFRPDRFLGEAQLQIDSDSVRIFFDTAMIRKHVTGDRIIRLGLRLTQTVAGQDSGRVNLLTVGSTIPPVFVYQPDTDTVHVAPFTYSPHSSSPATDSTLKQRLLTYPVIVSGTSPPVGQHLDIGGLPSRRVFVNFALPSRIVDSSTIVRATLTLTPIPNSRRGFFSNPPDSLPILAQAVVNSPTITDPGRAVGFNAPATVIPIDTTYYGLSPAFPDSVNVEFAHIARHWSSRGVDTVSRALALIVRDEGANPLISSFYPALPTVPPALRPHIHLAYIPRVGFGLP